MHQGVATIHEVPLPFDINSTQISDPSSDSPFINDSFLTPDWDLIGSTSFPNSVSTGTGSWDMIADPRMNTGPSPRQLEAAIRNIPTASDQTSPPSRHPSFGQVASSDPFSRIINQIPITSQSFEASDHLLQPQEMTYTHGSSSTVNAPQEMSVNLGPGSGIALAETDQNAVQTFKPTSKRKYNEEKKAKVKETRDRSSCIFCQLRKKEVLKISVLPHKL